MTTTLINMTLELWGAFFSLVFALITASSRKNYPRQSQFLTMMLVADAVMLISVAACRMFANNPNAYSSIIVKVGCFLYYALLPCLVCLSSFYFSEWLSRRREQIKYQILNTSLTLSAVHLLLIVVNQFNHILYHFDSHNNYIRSNGFSSIAILGIAEMFLLLAIGFFIVRDSHRKRTRVLIPVVAIPGIAITIQTSHYGVNFLNVAISISLMLLFFNHQVNINQQFFSRKALLAQKERELTDAKLQISISQMRPHFLFNALGSIEQLCKTNPYRAAEATHHFSQYLRNNIDVLSQSDMIDFTEEVSHIRTYVWLEAMRFGDDLQFHEYLQDQAFQLPALSIQPLVENSIKHGMSGTEDTLHVTLATKEEADAHVIIVCDNGGGFDTEAPLKTDRAHIGLSNVKDRIRLMSKGTIEIDSTIGKGTRITIRIPKDQPSAAHSTM